MELFGKYNDDEEFKQKAIDFLNIFKCKDVIVWGVGKSTKTFLNTGNKLNIKYLVDININLHETYFEGYKIRSPDYIKNEDVDKTIIVIMPYFYDKYFIAQDLESMGYGESSYCFGYDYIIAYSYFNENKVILPTLDIFITSFCTLKCKNCIAHLVYYVQNKNAHIPFDSVKNSIDNIFSVIDYINLLSFSTGEVIMHPDFIKIIEYIATKYINNYRLLHFVTNGTVIPKGNILEILNKYGCHVYISNYSHVIKHRSKIPELIDLFKKNKISFSIFNDFQAGRLKLPCWNDLGNINISHGKSEEEKVNIYHKCTNHTCFVAHENKIYPCGSAPWGAFGGVYEPSPIPEDGDYINISSTRKDRLDIIKFFLRATTKGYPAICDRCDGIGPFVNKKTILAGEQLK